MLTVIIVIKMMTVVSTGLSWLTAVTIPTGKPCRVSSRGIAIWSSRPPVRWL